MSLTWDKSKSLRWLDFDIENRPLSYLGMDFTTAEITAIAWGWTDQSKVVCLALGDDTTGFTIGQADMLNAFRDAYDQADGVTGHYIRKHDLPIINGALMEHELEPLGPKLTCDTKMDLIKRKDLSASQESLSGMYGLPRAKHHMSQTEWREANRLTDGGIALTRKRVIDDVKQHRDLRVRLLKAGALHGPKVWYP